ncbi:Putative ribonuclease H protein At1g65750 [Linum perenne]
MLWRRVWKWEGPAKIKHFLWLASHGKLMTNAERRKRHITVDVVCPVCQSNCEDTEHVLRRCSFAHLVWRPTGEGWVSLNSDGSLYTNPSRAAAGGVLRDGDGRFLAAYAANLGTCSIMRAELRGIVEGMKLAWERGVRKLLIQTDSREAVDLLSSLENRNNQHAILIKQVAELSSRDWVVSIQHIYVKLIL